MALHAYEEESPYGQNSGENSTVKTNPIKRIRWATHRAGTVKGNKKRQSILDRLHKRTPSDKTTASEATDSEGSAEQDSQDGKRTIFFNRPLPVSARDEEGHPLTVYGRNKIRTAKYTPLSFVPKNLWFQFHNIANIYFLFIIILSVSLAVNTSIAIINAISHRYLQFSEHPTLVCFPYLLSSYLSLPLLKTL